MYILQISDLHISNAEDQSFLENKINLMVSTLFKEVRQDEKMVICILGDLVDQGNAKLFAVSIALLNTMYNKLKQHFTQDNVAILFIPGNHDLCKNEDGKQTLTEFNDSIKAFPQSFTFNDTNSIHEVDLFGYHFIAISSVRDNVTKYGQIDFQRLNKCTLDRNTIILVHHSLISSDEDDSAAIRNGYALQQFLENENVISLLHGHTHGCKRYTVGNDCQVIGVGPMFKPIYDVPNQCNLIEIVGSKIIKISNYIYQGDINEWISHAIYCREDSNNYYGQSVYDVYQRVKKDAESGILLPNLRIQIQQPYHSFESEISSYFKEYENDANDWQSFTCPDTLYYTHGQLMSTDTKTWIDFAVEKLKSNPTNKRTIIPLITKDMSFNSLDEPLVSFDSVQLGFQDGSYTHLYVTIYFRALEIGQFLPINLYESYLMAKKLKGHFPAINSVTICFFTFRAEFKDAYICYRKSEIDLMRSTQLGALIQNNNFDKIISLLSAKESTRDSIINLQWIENLRDAFTDCYEGENKDNIIKQIDKIYKNILEFKTAREHCSGYKETEAQESAVTTSITELITILRTCGHD